MRSRVLIVAFAMCVSAGTLAVVGAPLRHVNAVADRSTTGTTTAGHRDMQNDGFSSGGASTGRPGLRQLGAPGSTFGLAGGTSPSDTPGATDMPGPTNMPGPTETPSPSGTPPPTGTPTPSPSPSPSPPGCTGSPLTSQSQVRPNTPYCGGTVHGQIVLASGDSWTGGDVSGAVTGYQRGAVQCGNPCWLYNMNIHDNPRAFAGIYALPNDMSGPFVVSGGRVTGSGNVGIGSSNSRQVTVRGVEIDHNGASANCSDEGGGFKGTSSGSRFTDNYVHDNNCMGVWYDINSANNQIDHNRVDNNSNGGIFYEISQDASIHDNEVSGNGAGACAWLWGAGIGIASSFNIQVYNNTITNNCNAVGETQQNRLVAMPPAHLLENVSVTGNTIRGTGKTGAVADNGAVLSTRNLSWSNNAYSSGAAFCGITC